MELFALEPDHREAQSLLADTRSRMKERQERAMAVARAARIELDRGDLVAASLLVDRLVSVERDSPYVIDLRKAINDARLRLADARERARSERPGPS
jgi:hypothetical protein